jgi:hypothetical protein
MLRDINCVNVSGKIFWYKLDEKENYSTLRLGLDIGDGSYNRIFLLISNPHQKAHQFIKNDNQAVIIGAWLDSWTKNDGDIDLQIKGYDSNIQFYPPEAVIPHFNEVFVYGSVKEFNDGVAMVDCIGNRNPKTNEFTHRIFPVDIGSAIDDPVGKKLMIRGSMGQETLENNKSKTKVSVDYDKINIMR